MKTSLKPPTFVNAVTNVWLNFLERAAETHQMPWAADIVDDGLGKGGKQAAIVDAQRKTVAFTADTSEALAWARFANIEFA